MPGLLSSLTVANLVHTYGLLVVFGLVALESMGLPLPGETALVGAALYAGATGQLSVFAIVGAAAAGAILGDNLGYLVGRQLGVRLLARYGGHVGLDPDRIKVGQYLFWRHGGKIVFFGRFVAFLRAFAALLAGADQMPWRRFLLFNALGAVTWASVYGAGAYTFGREIERVARPVSALLFAAAVIGILAGILFFRRHEKELEARARQVFPDP